MTNQEVKQFLNAINRDQGLMEKFMQAKTITEQAEIVKKAGLKPDMEDLRELSDDELDNIAGGTGQDVLFTCECLTCGWRSSIRENLYNAYRNTAQKHINETRHKSIFYCSDC